MPLGLEGLWVLSKASCRRLNSGDALAEHSKDNSRIEVYFHQILKYAVNPCCGKHGVSNRLEPACVMHLHISKNKQSGSNIKAEQVNCQEEAHYPHASNEIAAALCRADCSPFIFG